MNEFDAVVQKLVDQIRFAVMQMLNETCDELEPKFTKDAERKAINAFSDVLGMKIINAQFNVKEGAEK